MAADGWHPKTVRYLLSKKTDLDLQTRHFNYSALMLAAKNGDIDCVTLLLQHGADKTLEDIEGNTAAWYAKQRKHWQVFRLLSTRPDSVHQRTKN